MNAWGWLAAAFAVLLAGSAIFWLIRSTREAIRTWFERSARATVLRFRSRLDRYKLVSRLRVKDALLHDPLVQAAIVRHAEASGLPRAQVQRRVERYIDEIVPFFNVLSYYRFGYNLSRLVLWLLYRVEVAHQDEAALARIPRRDVVVYLMNHRSNADYVVVAYVLARVVSISYAVGEWARTWPLEWVFKSFGSYFVRRRFKEPLYHTVLERYVQLITMNGVTQGIFPEGGLTQDGALRPPRLGLLDHILRTLADPAFDRDIWFVPVGINYDRVLEDRMLIRERIVGAPRPGRLAQAASVVPYLITNAGRLLTGRLRRYGRVAVTFGAPISARAWADGAGAGVLDLPREERLPHLQRFGDLAMERIGAVIPVTPVPLAAAALLSFGASVVRHDRLLERMDELRDALAEGNAKLVRGERPVTEVWDRAWRMFRLRGLVARAGNDWVLLPGQRPLLEYYANSIRHLLPAAATGAFHPAHEPDSSLPRLATRAEVVDRGARRGP
ncbi:MAG: 1-acyl-sn-glycerol-3-phosphate acyltransferase [Gemmatimonadales bacterium]